ncbi:hypothetical protein [Cellulomonas pakistanensis]|uniref:Uncharacterized protein n=1 Tax=Cellulomonas pakistanensis TaxID=992287 RepID=A0A919PBQ9_9CELL|nr:hypothetical protein [Cellulomonas pakistanensis]GIG38085.1 hypothetical protein Cpa01nite_34660 [Cellulomonas pakistanensis]
MKHQISRIDLRLPPRWCGWRPGDAPRVAQRFATDLTSGPVAAARLRSAIEAVDRAVVGHHSRHVRAGAWVPEPSGDVVAGLACELLAEVPDGPGAAASYLHRVRRKIYRSRTQTTRYAYHATSLREVPAGDAVVTLRSHGVLRHEVIWTVLPPGSAEAVELRFDTRSSERYQDLITHAETIAHGLQVVLAAPRPSTVLPGAPRPPAPRPAPAPSPPGGAVPATAP